ncbi:hypothetical protein HYW67_04435 [Candidatus Parcubacteria bacterium]|nr:hypothetical protein [Candidatus Parcubacteria bacterium]
MNVWRWLRARFSGEATGEVVCVFDMGTSVVKAAILGLDYDAGTTSILGLGQAKYAEPLVMTETLPEAPLTPVFEAALDDARRQHRGKVRRAYIVGQSPFIGGGTFTFSYVRETPKVKIEAGELKAIIQKVQWRALEKIKKEMRAAAVLYARITEVRIDGYQVASPIGFQGREVTLTIFNIYASPTVLGSFTEHLKAFKLELAGITTQTLSFWSWLAQTRSAQFGAITIDVGGAGTRVAVFRRGRLDGERVFSIGAMSLARRLVEAFSVTPAIAQDILAKYEVGGLSTAVTEKIAALLAGDIELWKQGLTLVLKEFAKADVLPQEVFLVGNSRDLSGVSQAVRDLTSVPELAFAGDLSLALPDVSDVHGLRDPRHLFTRPFFAAVLAGLEFTSRAALRHDFIAKTLRRATRLLQPT